MNNKQGVVERYIPPNEEKYMAYFCVCRSCRLSTGMTLIPWCYVPPANLTIASTGEPIHLGKQAEEAGANEGTTLKHYKSSADVYRSFCGTCGATVFYWADEPGHAVVDVAVGLLRTEEGSMARRWLAWCWGRVAWKAESDGWRNPGSYFWARRASKELKGLNSDLEQRRYIGNVAKITPQKVFAAMIISLPQ